MEGLETLGLKSFKKKKQTAHEYKIICGIAIPEISQRVFESFSENKINL